MAGIENVSNYSNARLTASNATTSASTTKSDSTDVYGLDMSDFLSLMVAQFTNQTMDSTADTSEMLNQLVQMQMVTALANVTSALETVTDQSIMSYAASLVGKEVTVAGYDENGTYAELVGTVSATGSYGGEQVIFINDEMFYMTQIIAVGRLPDLNTGDTNIGSGVESGGNTVAGSGNSTAGVENNGGVIDTEGESDATVDNVENSGATEGNGTDSGAATEGDITGSDVTDNVANSGVTEGNGTDSGTTTEGDITGSDGIDNVTSSGATENNGNDTPTDTDATESEKNEESDIAEEISGEN